MALFLEQKKILCGSWIASVVTESAQVLEKHQMESPGSLQSQPWASPRPPELPQLCPAPTKTGRHGQHMESSSFTVCPVLQSHPRRGEMLHREQSHVNNESHKVLSQTCQTSPAQSTGLQHPGTAHPCLPTNSTSC